MTRIHHLYMFLRALTFVLTSVSFDSSLNFDKGVEHFYFLFIFLIMFISCNYERKEGSQIFCLPFMQLDLKSSLLFECIRFVVSCINVELILVSKFLKMFYNTFETFTF
jgi:hypothetical protein